MHFNIFVRGRPPIVACMVVEWVCLLPDKEIDNDNYAMREISFEEKLGRGVLNVKMLGQIRGSTLNEGNWESFFTHN